MTSKTARWMRGNAEMLSRCISKRNCCWFDCSRLEYLLLSPALYCPAIFRPLVEATKEKKLVLHSTRFVKCQQSTPC